MQSRIASEWAATLSSQHVNVDLASVMTGEQEALVWLMLSNNPAIHEFTPNTGHVFNTSGNPSRQLLVYFANPMVKFEDPDKPEKRAKYFILENKPMDDAETSASYAAIMRSVKLGNTKSAIFISQRSFKLSQESSNPFLIFKSRIHAPLALKFCTRKSGFQNVVYSSLKKVSDQRPHHEFEMSKLMPHLGIRKPFFLEFNRYYLRMNKVGTMDLIDLLNDMIKYPQKYSMQKRAYLSIAIVRALDSQVHEKGCVHRDISESNFRVDECSEPPYFKATIIDLEFSKLQPTVKEIMADKSDYYEACGSKMYAPPESFRDALTSAKSDLFAVMKLLWLVWGGPQCAPNPMLGETMVRMPNKSDFFKRLSLSENEKELIYSLFRKAHTENMASRPSAPEIISTFESIISSPESTLTLRATLP